MTGLVEKVGGSQRLPPGPSRDRPGNQVLLVWAADGVPDRGAYPNNVVGAEVRCVVEDSVVTHFRTDEKIPFDVITQASSQVDEEVVGTLVAGAKVHAAARRYVAVEASSLPADAGHQVRANLLAQTRLVHAVKVEKNRAKGLTAGATVGSLGSLPGGVKAEAHPPVENHIGAEIYVQASVFGTSENAGSRRAARGSTRGDYCSKAEHGIRLLGRSQVRKDEKSEDGRNQDKPSQEEPPVMIINGR